MHCVMCLLLCVCLLVAGHASLQGARQSPERVIISETASATCCDAASGRVLGSTLVRSPILVSPDGRYQAYAENEAVAHRGSGVDCVSRAKLFVRRSGEKEFHLEFLEEPRTDQLFNNIRVVDWSPDSRYLLSELFVGQWGSDTGGSCPLLYDAWEGVFSRGKMADMAVSKNAGHDCPYLMRSVGFAREGGVVEEIGPVFDEEGGLDPASCVKKKGLWLLNATAETLVPLQDTYKVQRYGHLLLERSNR